MIEIRNISIKDLQGYWKALDSVAKEKRYLAFTEAPSLENMRRFVEKNIKHNYPHFVAEVDGKIVGWCDISPSKKTFFAHKGVLGMGIIKEFRGQGIGEKLILSTINAAIDFGLKRIELEVYANNEQAIKLYKKVGFQVEGRKRKALFMNGKYYDELLMAKLMF